MTDRVLFRGLLPLGSASLEVHADADLGASREVSAQHALVNIKGDVADKERGGGLIAGRLLAWRLVSVSESSSVTTTATESSTIVTKLVE